MARWPAGLLACWPDGPMARWPDGLLMTDSHCHIAGEEFIADLPHVVDRARAAGVSRALVILAAEDDAEIERANTVRTAWPECGFAIGVHPHHAKGFDEATFNFDVGHWVLGKYEAFGDIWAIGEIGLDYHYDFSPREVQQEVFRSQLETAASINCPVVIHSREAEEDTLRIISEVKKWNGGILRGVFHCFTGGPEAAQRALATGFYLSIPGVITFSKAEELRETVKQIPADRLLVETDSPYLAPIPFRGKRNEPSYVAKVVEQLAVVRGVTAADISEQTDRNFERLFRP
jgi:TatD DNase family protein